MPPVKRNTHVHVHRFHTQTMESFIPLVRLLDAGGSDDVQAFVARTIHNIASNNNDDALAIIHADAIAPLMEIIKKSDTNELKMAAASALHSLVYNDGNKSRINNADGIEDAAAFSVATYDVVITHSVETDAIMSVLGLQ